MLVTGTAVYWVSSYFIDSIWNDVMALGFDSMFDQADDLSRPERLTQIFGSVRESYGTDLKR